MRTGARSFTSLNWRVGLGVFFLIFLGSTSLQAQSMSPLTVNSAGGYANSVVILSPLAKAFIGAVQLAEIILLISSSLLVLLQPSPFTVLMECLFVVLRINWD